MTQDYDVAVIGGGAAGLSAAVTLSRSLRSVVVIDAGAPRNAVSHAAHNLLGREGVSPAELVAAGREEAASYGATLRSDRVRGARRAASGFELDLESGETVRCRRLLLTTGLVDELPDIPGVQELWGGSVLHCAYCHGWEVRGQRIGVLATGPLSVHQALVFRQLSDRVTFFLHDHQGPDDEERRQFAALGIEVVEGRVSHLRTQSGVLHGVVLVDGQEHVVDAVTVSPRLVARSSLFEQLGGEVTEHVAGSYVATGPMGRTGLPGVFAAGNLADLGAMLSAATGSGVTAATAINGELVAEDAAAAVARSGVGDRDVLAR
jgi:thioredoxin reductase